MPNNNPPLSPSRQNHNKPNKKIQTKTPKIQIPPKRLNNPHNRNSLRIIPKFFQIEKFFHKNNKKNFRADFHGCSFASNFI